LLVRPQTRPHSMPLESRRYPSLVTGESLHLKYSPFSPDHRARTYYVVLQAGQISFRAALDTGMMRASLAIKLHATSVLQVLPTSGLLLRNVLPVHACLCQDTLSLMPVPRLCPSTITKPLSLLATLMGLVCTTIRSNHFDADGVTRCIRVRCQRDCRSCKRDGRKSGIW
jgi:hypothetical protein